MDLCKKQLSVYKKIVNGGLYDINGVKIVTNLIKQKGYPEFLHNQLIEQLSEAVSRLEKTNFDKISVVMKASDTAAKNLMNKFIDVFPDENVTVTTIDYSKVPPKKIPYKYRLRIYWKESDVSMSVYFFNKRRNNVSNIKVDFNLKKSREQSLSVFAFIYNNLPKTKALNILHNATITRLERYFLLNNIPVWGTLASRAMVVRGTNRYSARKNENFIASSYYISKDNSKELVVYDKYASDSKLDLDDPERYNIDEAGNINEAFQSIVSDLSRVETKFEIRNFKNKMNKKQRRKSLFFCSPSTFPSFFRAIKFYSPLLLKELNEAELSKLIRLGFYNFIITDEGTQNKLSSKRFEKYIIEIDKNARKSLESNFMVVFYAYLQDLGREIGVSVLDPDKPFSKRRNNKFYNAKI